MLRSEAAKGRKSLLGAFENAVNGAVSRAAADSLIPRIWQKDPAVWKKEPGIKEISDRLGWLDAPFIAEDVLDGIIAFAGEVRKAGFRSVVLMGMGGSSLAPELFQSVFGNAPGFPEMIVLDSTDPERVLDVHKSVNISKTLFIFASKSGTTTEPLSFFRYFWQEASRVLKEKTGQNFCAITDPGTFLAGLAQEKKFRKIFLADPNVGGRYSALTLFGLVPAALIGVDIRSMVEHARKTAEKCRETDPETNPALVLGAAMGVLSAMKRDKLTLITSRGLEPLGDWVEQLVAESTGKEGTGVTPVIREPLGPVSEYGPDRFFVAVLDDKGSRDIGTRLEKLASLGHPVMIFRTEGAKDIGSEFFRWEMATAVAGAVLGINPFDQPNVQEAKDKTKELLKVAETGKRIPFELAPIKWSTARGIAGTVVFGGQTPKKGSDPSAEDAGWAAFWKTLKPGDAAHVLAFLPDRKLIKEKLAELRLKVRKAANAAVTASLGPRYLHSTGQLHKGGPDRGIFLVITADRKTKLPVPEENYTFETLEYCQAVGDFQALDGKGRRVFFLELADFSAKSLAGLGALVDKALRK